MIVTYFLIYHEETQFVFHQTHELYNIQFQPLNCTVNLNIDTGYVDCWIEEYKSIDENLSYLDSLEINWFRNDYVIISFNIAILTNEIHITDEKKELNYEGMKELHYIDGRLLTSKDKNDNHEFHEIFISFEEEHRYTIVSK